MSTFGGPSKRIVNAYLAHVARGKVLVLDTRALGTSRAMAETVGKRKIVAFGTDPKLEKRCKKFGIKCEKGWSGDVLAKLQKQKQLFDIIYLDYCGTPDGNDMFDPMEDMARASTMLTRGGILACTFCKRSSQVMSKCINMTPPTLSLQRSFEYCDTSAMVFVVYSARKLPMIGPSIGSIVDIKYKRTPYRVLTLYLDGMKLQAVKKKGTEWVDDKSYGELDDVFFDEIKEIVMWAPYENAKLPKQAKKSKKIKKQKKVDTLDLKTFIQLVKDEKDERRAEKPAPAESEMAVAKTWFKKFFKECIDRKTSGSLGLSINAGYTYYKSWCEARGIPEQWRLKSRDWEDMEGWEDDFHGQMCDSLGISDEVDFYPPCVKVSKVKKDTMKSAKWRAWRLITKVEYNKKRHAWRLKACNMASESLQ